MNAALRARVLATAERAPSMTRRQGRVAGFVLAALSIAIGLGAFFGLGGFAEAPDRSHLRVADGWGLASAFITWLVLFVHPRGRRRATSALAAITALAPLALYAWIRAFPSWAWPDDRAELVCFGFASLVSATPLASFIALRRGSEPEHPGLLGAAAGAMCGSWAHVLALARCPLTSAWHATMGHVAQLSLTIVLGAALGARFLGVRASRARR